MNLGIGLSITNSIVQQRFSPSSIEGLKLWLDADDSSTITIETGVSQWDDKSEQENNATQAVGASQPTLQPNVQNGKAVMRLGSAPSFFDLTSPIASNVDWTFFVVYNKTTSASKMLPLIDKNNTQGPYTWVDWIDSNIYIQATGVNLYGSSGGGGATDFQIGTSANTSGVPTAWVNGVPVGMSVVTTNTNTTVLNSIGLRGIEFSSGDIAEIIMYDSVLSPASRGSVEVYLANKWGL